MQSAASSPQGMEAIMRFARILPALLLVGGAPPQRYTIDAAQSEVSARVAFFGLASKTARFPQVSGGITLAADDPERIDLTVTIDARTITAPDKVTLERLRGPRFFDVENHPTIVFRGQRMRIDGDRNAEVAGRLTARGVTRPATLSVRFAEPPLHADGRRPLGLTGETMIDRRDFGMTAYRFIVGRKVRISIQAVLAPA